MHLIMRLTLYIAILLVFPLVSRAELKEYTVAGNSMFPALMPGDKVVVDTDVKNQLQRGDIVVVAFANSLVPMIKRIIAVPGDYVAFSCNAVWVNGQRIRQIDIRKWRSTVKQIERYGNIVPLAHYLVLGDNPGNSRDSSRLGLISQDSLKGRNIAVKAREIIEQ